MALLNKLFFPSATSAAPQAPAPSSPASSSLSAGGVSSSLLHANATAAWTSSSAAPSPAAAAFASGPSASLSVLSSASASSSITATSASSAASAASINARRQNNNQSVHSKNYLSQFPFDGRQVRVLLYRECDSRRRLLFDSNALQRVSLKDANVSSGPVKGDKHHHHQQQQQQSASKGQFIEVCEKYGYKHNRPNSADITSVGEMVFGALAMSFRGTALKVHWLNAPARILCSQVFLTPLNSSSSASASGQSPYSTISMSSLTTPRTSISSEHGSIDGLSMSSFSMPFSVSVGRHMSLTPSDRSSMTCPLDVPDSVSTNSDSGPRYSSTYSTGTDSGYSGISRSQLSSDQWSASYQYSTRSSLGSVLSDQSDPLRKFSMDSASFPSSTPLFEDGASDGSLQRRISRNLRTSFENEHSVNDFIGFASDNYWLGGAGGGVAGGAGAGANAAGGTTGSGGSEGGCMGVPNYRRASCANESRSNPEMGRRRDVAALKSMTRRAKLGLAVCITMSESFEEEMELFCSEHIALLESMLSRLRASTERAYINHSDFLQIMYHAWQDTQQWFNDLFTAPRIKCPVWLSITTSGSKYSKNVADRFIKELCWLLSFADTKDSNFFISTMLTAILTHHLGWVSTVSAFHPSSSRAERSTAAIEQRAKLLQVAQKRPYNALWAQMGDLYGALGMPPKLARTIIYGSEKLSVERLLNILTYFIRCGEVRRSAKREDFNKELVNSLVCQNNNETLRRSTNAPLHASRAGAALKRSGGSGGSGSGGSGAAVGCGGMTSGGGLSRTQTCKQNLNTISDNYEASSGSGSGSGEELDEAELVQTLKKNEIPNVLAFRDSRFVQQELRIGNYLMDTGIEKSSMPQGATGKSGVSSPTLTAAGKDGRIRLTVTTPDNVELCVEDGALEAIEIDGGEGGGVSTGGTYPTTAEAVRRNLFWKIAPPTVREGVSLAELGKATRKFERRSSSFSSNQSEYSSGIGAGREGGREQLEKRMSHLSLSDLITQNSMGKSDRMTWGIEPIKENVSLEEQIHFDFCHKMIERQHGISRDDSSVDSSSVVFVLGDNEPLVNLKRSTEDLAATTSVADGTKAAAGPATTTTSVATTRLCALHQQTHGPTHTKKHSGVKFNFEQYPQIATNYMKSKNLVMTNYDLLMDKCSKLEAYEIGAVAAAATAAAHAAFPTASIVVDEPTVSGQAAPESCAAKAAECIVCQSILNSYQTPSNATELEFESDEVHCHTNTTAAATMAGRTLHPVSSAASVDTLKSSSHGGVNEPSLIDATNEAVERRDIQAAATGSPAASGTAPAKRMLYKKSSHRGSTSSAVATKCAAVNEAVHLLKLPVPGIKELPQDDEPPGDMKLRAGFVPSLFLNVSDHYISDMVLQGTCASPNKWEMTLREDLALAAHSASLISLPAENIAIVADMVKWDVRLISSQAQCFPYAGGQSAPVGMSQLVSSMLETVQAMNSAGISAYECLSYLESKMQEIYLQSETLAAFLLETDFCSLSAVTTALNLAENDVPLLLSIASIHTPQISKKCGISFR